MSELIDQEVQDKITKIANHATRKEKMAWDRKRKKLTGLIENDLVPLQEKEREVIAEQMPILDKINEVRKQMVETCIHPQEELVYNEDGDYFTCKFCGSNLNVR